MDAKSVRKQVDDPFAGHGGGLVCSERLVRCFLSHWWKSAHPSCAALEDGWWMEAY
jgi:hypothetical protein